MTESFLPGFLTQANEWWSVERCIHLASSENACSALDCEIESAQEAIRDIVSMFEKILLRIRGHRNRILPISRLPAEVLCAIFESAGACGERYLDNLHIASVCRHWRSVALGNPRMWTSVDIRRTPRLYLDVALSRSTSLPLQFLDPHKGEPSLQGWRLATVRSYLPRIQRLELQELKDIRLGEVETSSPLILTHLLLHYGDPPEHTPDLLLANMPLLRSLDLHNCRRPWISGMYRGLTHLRIVYAHLYDDSDIDLVHAGEDIAVVVRECPGLQLLDICCRDACIYCMPTTLSSTPPPTRTEMWALRRLSLDLPMPLVIHLLSSISLRTVPDDVHICAFDCRDAQLGELLFSPHCLPPALLFDIRRLSLTIGKSSFSVTRAGPGHSSSTTEALTTSLKIAVEWDGAQSLDFDEATSRMLAAVQLNCNLPGMVSLAIHHKVDCRSVDGHQWEQMSDGGVAQFILQASHISSLTLEYWSLCALTTTVRRLQDYLLSVETSTGTSPFTRLDRCALKIGAVHYPNSKCPTSCLPSILHFLHTTIRQTPLLKIEIRDSRIPVHNPGTANTFIRGMRDLNTPRITWSSSAFYVMRQYWPRDVQRFTAGDVWPRGVAYDWQCAHDDSHEARHRQGEDPGVKNCCRGENPRTQIGFRDMLSQIAERGDMYDIFADFAQLLPSDGDGA